MKRIAIASLLISSLAAAQAEVYTDQARVHSVQPVLENISVPRQECRAHWVAEPVRSPQWERTQSNPGGAILGGIAGGVIGHQIGRGNGRAAATALGVILGAAAGDQLSQRQAPEPQWDNLPEHSQRQVQRCETVYDNQSRVTGYHVNYEYRGQHLSTTTRQHPGDFIQVRVSVDPVTY